MSPSGQDERERTLQRTETRRLRNGETGILPANGEQKRDLARRRRDAEGEKYKDCLPWFIFAGIALFAGKGGFAADLGRFAETTLPFFSMGTDALPPEGRRGATPSK